MIWRADMTIRVGSYFPDRDQSPLSPGDAEIVHRFHELYYRRWLSGGSDTINLSWFGHQVLKCPLDVWLYQELLVRTRPDIVVETGTWCGGSALYMAMILEQIGHGRVITIDIDPKPDRPDHPKISYLTGSSTDPQARDPRFRPQCRPCVSGIADLQFIRPG
jgi:cephalosporin hydroxylase